MNAGPVFSAMLRLVSPDETSQDSPTEPWATEAVVRGAETDEVGLALQMSLRESLRLWVRNPDPRHLRRYLRASEALLSELDDRKGIAAKADDRMMSTLGTSSAAGQWDTALARARSCVKMLAQDAAKWLTATPRVARRDAESLAWQLQDAAVELLELAGRGDARDDRQASWLRLVADPHLVDLGRDDHACALIGAACWHDRGSGHLVDWQALAWRLWSLDSRDLSRLVLESRWLWVKKLRPLSQVGKALVSIRALIIDSRGKCHLRTREEAAKAALNILQARRCDAQAAITMGMTTTEATFLPGLKG